MISPIEYYERRLTYLVPNKEALEQVKKLLKQAKMALTESARIHLYKKLDDCDSELSKFYQKSLLFSNKKLPIFILRNSSFLYHVSLVQFSNTLLPSNRENYFIPSNENLVSALQYILLWKFEMNPENKRKIWRINTFQTTSTLSLTYLFPTFNVSDVFVKVPEIKEKTLMGVDRYFCQNSDGIFRQGEMAVLTIPEIVLSKSTVNLKLRFISSQPVDEFVFVF